MTRKSRTGISERMFEKHIMNTGFNLDRSSQRLYMADEVLDISSLPEIRQRINSLESGIRHDLYVFLEAWFSEGETMSVQTSGSTGTPKVMEVSKRSMMQSACRTCMFLNLHKGNTMLLSMNLKYIGAQMMVVRALVGELTLVLREPSAHPLADVTRPMDFLSMVPMQLAATLENERECGILNASRIVIVGGGAVDRTLEERLQHLSCRAYSTYGMTETLSHVAMRCLNGSERSDRYFPLDGVTLSLSDRNTLIIDVPDVCREKLVTNDVVKLFPDGSFQIKGRADNVVNSGGVKIQIEEDERMLQSVLPVPFVLTAVPDAYYGERLVLLWEETTGCRELKAEWQTEARALLPKYHYPGYWIKVSGIPRTDNGKIDRSGCRILAQKKTGSG